MHALFSAPSPPFPLAGQDHTPKRVDQPLGKEITDTGSIPTSGLFYCPRGYHNLNIPQDQPARPFPSSPTHFPQHHIFPPSLPALSPSPTKPGAFPKHQPKRLPLMGFDVRGIDKYLIATPVNANPRPGFRAVIART